MTIDITDASDSRFAIGVGGLADGSGVTFHGLYIAVREGELLVTEQSGWKPSNLTEPFARAQFASMKDRLQKMSGRNSDFDRYLDSYPQRLTLIDDYGMGPSSYVTSTVSGSSVQPVFIWHPHKANQDLFSISQLIPLTRNGCCRNSDDFKRASDEAFRSNAVRCELPLK